MYMSWRDERLKHNETGYVLINDKKILDRMWVIPRELELSLLDGCLICIMQTQELLIFTKLRSITFISPRKKYL